MTRRRRNCWAPAVHSASAVLVSEQRFVGAHAKRFAVSPAVHRRARAAVLEAGQR